MPGHLLVVAGPDLGQVFPLQEGQTLVVGRGDNTSTRLHDPHVSRVHCQVRSSGGQVLLTDAGSTAGTLVNGKRVSRHELQPGDLVQIGTTQLRFLGEEIHDESTIFSVPAPVPRPGEQPPAFSTLKASVEEDVLVVTLTRSQLLDQESADEVLREMLEAVAHAGTDRVALNLQHLKYASSAAFQPLLHLRRHLEQRGGRLVVCGLSNLVAELGRIAQQVGPGQAGPAPFEVAADVPAAVARLAGETTEGGGI